MPQIDTNPKVYKSLYEVKDAYFPNANLEFLEAKDVSIFSDYIAKDKLTSSQIPQNKEILKGKVTK
jgi:hypothetical protein